MQAATERAARSATAAASAATVAAEGAPRAEPLVCCAAPERGSVMNAVLAGCALQSVHRTQSRQVSRGTRHGSYPAEPLPPVTAARAQGGRQGWLCPRLCPTALQLVCASAASPAACLCVHADPHAPCTVRVPRAEAPGQAAKMGKPACDIVCTIARAPGQFWRWVWVGRKEPPLAHSTALLAGFSSTNSPDRRLTVQAGRFRRGAALPACPACLPASAAPPLACRGPPSPVIVCVCFTEYKVQSRTRAAITKSTQQAWLPRRKERPAPSMPKPKPFPNHRCLRCLRCLCGGCEGSGSFVGSLGLLHPGAALWPGLHCRLGRQRAACPAAAGGRHTCRLEAACWAG
jgi:hypothetical protein